MQLKTPAGAHSLNQASVLEKTGKPLEHWYALLDKWGARQKTHKEIAAYLGKELKLPPWWGQMVAVQYERDRGLRELNQKCDGEFSMSKSITLRVPVSKIFAAWNEPRARAAWLKPDSFEITTANANKNIRGKWSKGKSRLEIRFYPKGKSKVQAVLDHGKLAGPKDVLKFKKFWEAQLERLAEHLEG